MNEREDGQRDDIEGEALDELGGRSGDAPPPASPVQRSISGSIAILFIVAIAAFLIWFMATHTERRDGTPLGATWDGPGSERVAIWDGPGAG